MTDVFTTQFVTMAVHHTDIVVTRRQLCSISTTGAIRTTEP